MKNYFQKLWRSIANQAGIAIEIAQLWILEIILASLGLVVGVAFVSFIIRACVVAARFAWNLI